MRSTATISQSPIGSTANCTRAVWRSGPRCRRTSPENEGRLSGRSQPPGVQATGPSVSVFAGRLRPALTCRSGSAGLLPPRAKGVYGVFAASGAFTNAIDGVTLSVNDEAFSRLVHAPFDRTHVPEETQDAKRPPAPTGGLSIAAEAMGFEPTEHDEAFLSFSGPCIRPLCHTSVARNPTPGV